VSSFLSAPSSDASPASLIDYLSFLLFPDAPLFIPRSTLSSSMSSSKSPPVVLDYTVKPPVTQLYSHHGARLSDAPASSDELSFDVSYSSFVEDVSYSPPVEPSSPADSFSEQIIRRSHCLCRPLIITLLLLLQLLLFLIQLLIVMLFFILNGST
jgi:hypothetical protein